MDPPKLKEVSKKMERPPTEDEKLKIQASLHFCPTDSTTDSEEDSTNQEPWLSVGRTRRRYIKAQQKRRKRLDTAEILSEHPGSTIRMKPKTVATVAKIAAGTPEKRGTWRDDSINMNETPCVTKENLRRDKVHYTHKYREATRHPISPRPETSEAEKQERLVRNQAKRSFKWALETYRNSIYQIKLAQQVFFHQLDIMVELQDEDEMKKRLQQRESILNGFMDTMRIPDFSHTRYHNIVDLLGLDDAE